MTERRRVENNRAHFGAFSPVSVNEFKFTITSKLLRRKSSQKLLNQGVWSFYYPLSYPKWSFMLLRLHFSVKQGLEMFA